MEDCIIEGRIGESYGDVDAFLHYTEKLLSNVCHRSVNWNDRDDEFSRAKLQMILVRASEQNIPLHHNLAGHVGIDFPETRLE